MHSKKLRDMYFKFFKEKKHSLIPSASLIPLNDPSVLFNTAGMQPLVPYLLGEKHPSGKRLVNVQKCLRTVDFENIGDDTHHTFFEMLGNWSLGDFFKKDSIAWSFEFLTGKKWLNLPLNKLAFTVYQGDKSVPKDEDSYNYWKDLGAPADRIAYHGADNFWSAGETGPCGPSTEIFYWSGKESAPNKFDPEDETWVEIWNNVFITYNKDKKGKLTELKQRNVDTGMGFERTLATISGKKSAYETELFQPIIKKIEEISGAKYSKHEKEMRIIADHIRASVFIMGDENAVTPSNVDRGYILRRLIRRAVRYGKMLNISSRRTSKPCWITLLISSSTFFFSSSVNFLLNEKSNLNLSGVMLEPRCFMLLSTTLRNASNKRWVAVCNFVVSGEWSAKPPLNLPSAAVLESF